MTAVQMQTYIDRKALLSVGDLRVEVVVVDVKERWGAVRYQVRPVAGFGRAWVEQLTLIQEG